jgi:hypothetical protein
VESHVQCLEHKLHEEKRRADGFKKVAEAALQEADEIMRTIA